MTIHDMKGKVFLITGASTGIGEATARRAVDAGFNVVLAARSTEKLERLQAELGPESALAVTCDVADWQSQVNLVEQTLNRFGRIDVVFANAGFSKGSTFYGGDDKPGEQLGLHGDGGLSLESQSVVWVADAQPGTRVGISADGVSTLFARDRAAALSDRAHGSAGDLPYSGIQRLVAGLLCDVGTSAPTGAETSQWIAPRSVFKNAVCRRTVVGSSQKWVQKTLRDVSARLGSQPRHQDGRFRHE